MSINFIFVAQLLMQTMFGCALGNLLSIFIDRRFSSEQAETIDRHQILEAILASLKTSLYAMLWFVIFLLINFLGT